MNARKKNHTRRRQRLSIAAGYMRGAFKSGAFSRLATLGVRRAGVGSVKFGPVCHQGEPSVTHRCEVNIVQTLVAADGSS